MNFRKLIEQAMFELRDEFAVLVAKKLEELMGDAGSARETGARGAGARGPGASGKGARGAGARAGRPAKAAAAKAAGRRTRAPGAHMVELRDKLLAALADGAPRKRAQILEEAGLSADEAVRVATVLRRLKDEGLLVMKGTKASATYTLRSNSR